MKILLHDYVGHPFQVELSRELAHRGHSVLHTYSKQFQTPRGSLNSLESDATTLVIRPIDSGRPFPKHKFVARAWHERTYGRLLEGVAEECTPDVVILSNTPLASLSRVVRFARKRRIPVLLWMQDVISVAMKSILGTRLGWIGRAVGRHYTALEQRLLREIAGIVVIDESFLDFVRAAGSAVPTRVIANWAPLSEVQCWPPNSQAGRVRLLYSGTLGFKHRPELLLHLAEAFQGRDDVELLVRSEGPAADWLVSEFAQRALKRAAVSSFVPFDELPRELGEAHVLLALLEASAGNYSVPSKTLTSLCAGRPLLLSVPGANQAAQVVRSAGAGLVFEPNDEAGFIAGARTLVDQPALRDALGQQARAYAEAHFDVRRKADEFESFLFEIV